MTAERRPGAPKGLAPPGRKLWRELLTLFPDGWTADARDLALLAEAARLRDQVAALDEIVGRDGLMALGSTGQRVVHPAVLEARQARALLARLLGQLDVPDGEEEAAATPQTVRARRAAQARWQAEADKLARRRSHGA